MRTVLKMYAIFGTKFNPISRTVPHLCQFMGDAAPAALMKHLRAVTKDKRHVVYSLRHNMKDWHILAGTSERIENRIMGHTVGGLGDRVYGGNDAKLKVAYVAMEKASGFAP